MTMTGPISGAPPIAEPARGGVRSNVGNKERWLSALGGGALIAYGLARRSLPALTLAVAGGALLKHGVSGRSSFSRSLGMDRVRAREKLAPFRRKHRAAGALGPPPARAERSVTVARPQEELYRYWRNFENLPRFMVGIAEVEVIDDKRSRWVATMPVGKPLSWTTEITDDRENESIAWRAVDPPELEHQGSVRFVAAPGDRGTEVHVVVEDNRNAREGVLRRAAARLAGEVVDVELSDSLRRFKQLMEAGEIPTTEGQPSGRKAA